MLYRLEIRDDKGNEENHDNFEGTEKEILDEARNLLAEALMCDGYQKEILVIEVDTGTCVYQGTFDMQPHPDMWANIEISKQHEQREISRRKSAAIQSAIESITCEGRRLTIKAVSNHLAIRGFQVSKQDIRTAIEDCR